MDTILKLIGIGGVFYMGYRFTKANQNPVRDLDAVPETPDGMVDHASDPIATNGRAMDTVKSSVISTPKNPALIPAVVKKPIATSRLNRVIEFDFTMN